MPRTQRYTSSWKHSAQPDVPCSPPRLPLSTGKPAAGGPAEGLTVGAGLRPGGHRAGRDGHATPRSGPGCNHRAALPPGAGPGRGVRGRRRAPTGVRDAHASAALLNGGGAVQGIFVLVQNGGHGRPRSPAPQAPAGHFRQRSADPRHVATRRRTAPALGPRPSSPARGAGGSVREGVVPSQNGGGRASALGCAAVSYACSRGPDLHVPNNALKISLQNRPVSLLLGPGVRADTARLAGPVHPCGAHGFSSLPSSPVQLCA